MRLLGLLALVWLVTLGAAACGGEEEAPDGAAAGGAGDGGATLEVALTDFALEPAATSVEPGAYTIRVVNEGSVAHALKVDGPGGEAETPVLDPGESAELEVDLTEPGEVELTCPVGDHRDRGMEATLAVGGGAGTTTTDEMETETEDDSDYRY